MSRPWLPPTFEHPLHVDWGNGVHLRPIRAAAPAVRAAIGRWSRKALRSFPARCRPIDITHHMT